MIRKDPSFDSDKPHFYSQYWIDVAAGKSTSSAEPTLDEDADLDFNDEFEPVAAAPVETRPAPAPRPKAPEKKQEQPRSLSSLADLANIDLLMNRSAEMDEDVTPDIAGGAGAAEPAVTADFDASAVDEADDADESDDFEYEEDEDEEDDEWGNSHRPKQGKPKRRERNF